MPANFPLGVANNDRIVFSLATLMWERGAGPTGGGCPPVWVDDDISIESGGSSVVISSSITDIDATATFAILTDPNDAPTGSLSVNSTVITPASGSTMASVAINFDASLTVLGDTFYLEATNVGGCTDLIQVSRTAG